MEVMRVSSLGLSQIEKICLMNEIICIITCLKYKKFKFYF